MDTIGGGTGPIDQAPPHIVWEYRRTIASPFLFSLLAAVAVAATELIDTSGGVHKFLFACEERMRGAGDLKFHKRILLAVDLDGLTGGHGRAGDKGLVVRHILEHHFPIVGGMNLFFHF